MTAISSRVMILVTFHNDFYLGIDVDDIWFDI